MVRLADVLADTEAMYAGAPVTVKIYGTERYIGQLLDVSTVLPDSVDCVGAAVHNMAVVELACAAAIDEDEMRDFAAGCTALSIITQI